MKISKEQLKEFKEIWKKEYNQDLDDQLALEYANKLLHFISIIYKPIK